MTLEDIYFIGQTIAVVAIFGSLAYVAIQTRQNGRLMRAKAAWDAQMSFMEINERLASGDAISQLTFKVHGNAASLTPYEKYLVHRFMRGVLQRTEAQFALFNSSILDEEVWSLRINYVKSLMNYPAFAEIWEAEKKNSMFTRAFIAEMDRTPSTSAPTFMGAGG